MTKFKAFSFLLIGLFIFACTKEQAPDHTQLYEEIRQVNKMEFASLAVTKTVKTERSDWYKVGKRIAVYSYDTHLKAYIDLNLIAPQDMEFDEENKTVRLTLPPVQIEVAGRDMQMRKEYENVGMFRSNVTSQERAKMKEKANTELMKELQGNPEYKLRLDHTARQKARSYFETLFKNAGYTAYIQFSDETKPSGDFNLNNYE